MSSSSYFPHIPLQLLSFQFTIYCNLVSFAVPLPLCFLKCSVGVASAGYTEKPSTGRTVLLGKRKLYPPVLPTNLPIPAVPTVFSLSAAKTKMSEWEEDFPDDEVEKSPAKALTKTVKPPTPDKIPTSSVLEDEKVPEKPTTCTPPIPTRKASKLKWPPEEESENKIVTSDDIINEQEVNKTVHVLFEATSNFLPVILIRTNRRSLFVTFSVEIGS